jgi:hypothetical protein
MRTQHLEEYRCLDEAPVWRKGIVRDASNRSPATAAVEPVAGASGLGVEHQQGAADLACRRFGCCEQTAAEALPSG